MRNQYLDRLDSLDPRLLDGTSASPLARLFAIAERESATTDRPNRRTRRGAHRHSGPNIRGALAVLFAASVAFGAGRLTAQTPPARVVSATTLRGNVDTRPLPTSCDSDGSMVTFGDNPAHTGTVWILHRLYVCSPTQIAPDYDGRSTGDGQHGFNPR